MQQKEIDWRNLNVRRDREFEPLVDSLVHRHPSVFQHIKDFMVFAAMIGFAESKRSVLTKETIPITMHTYSTDQQDGFIYMIALLHQKDGSCLRDESLQETIHIFEEYCRGGLLEIQKWMNEHPTEDKTELLFNKILHQFAKSVETEPGSKSIPLPMILN